MDTTGALLGPLAAFAVLRATVDGYDAVFAVSFCVAALGVLVLVLFVPRRIAPAEHRSHPRRTGPDAARRARACCAGPAAPAHRVRRPARPHHRQRLLRLPAAPARTRPARPLFPLLPLGTAAAFLLLAVPLGALADRVGRRRLFLAGHGVLLLGYGLLLSPLARRPGRGRRARAARRLLRGHRRGARGRPAGAVPAEHQGAGLALVETGQALARFACSLAFGAAWSLWGERTALAVAAAALAVSAVVRVSLRPDPHRR